MTNRNPSSSSCPSCGARASGKFCNQCGAALAVSSCGNCGSALAAGARFCNECGSAVSGASGGAPTSGASASSAGRLPMYAPWGVAAIILVSVIGYFVGRGSDGTADASPAAGVSPLVAPFAAGGGAAPDISNMSPRERASRLYDRIMRYVEEGKKDSAQFFAPMALSSFEQLGPDLDIDARYDYGRVASETGNLEIAAAQADTILQKSPNHLLGLALSARTSTLKGDAGAAGKAWKAFLGAKDAEMKKTLPEYQMHATDIEQATRLAQSAR